MIYCNIKPLKLKFSVEREFSKILDKEIERYFKDNMIGHDDILNRYAKQSFNKNYYGRFRVVK